MQLPSNLKLLEKFLHVYERHKLQVPNFLTKLTEIMRIK